MNKPVTVMALQIIIERGQATKVSKEIWPWELPVYEAKFGPGFCVITGERECQIELPEVEEEFARLQSIFGVEEDTKQNYVDIAFGRGKAGIAELAKTMQGSKPKAKKAKKVKSKPAAETPKVVKPKPEKKAEPSANGDPLA